MKINDALKNEFIKNLKEFNCFGYYVNFKGRKYMIDENPDWYDDYNGYVGQAYDMETGQKVCLRWDSKDLENYFSGELSEGNNCEMNTPLEVIPFDEYKDSVKYNGRTYILFRKPEYVNWKEFGNPEVLAAVTDNKTGEVGVMHWEVINSNTSENEALEKNIDITRPTYVSK